MTAHDRWNAAMTCSLSDADHADLDDILETVMQYHEWVVYRGADSRDGSISEKMAWMSNELDRVKDRLMAVTVLAMEKADPDLRPDVKRMITPNEYVN